MLLLVGDNPFHGISHLAQEKARMRKKEVTNPDYAAHLVMIALENGADGFMFSVSNTTLAILEKLKDNSYDDIYIYAIIPYAYEFVRLAVSKGILGLARGILMDIIRVHDLHVISYCVKGIIDPINIIKCYISYELKRIRKAIGNKARIKGILLHEVLTEMMIGFDLDNIARNILKFSKEIDVRLGFETRNFAHLISKLRNWNIDLRGIPIAAPFNTLGFQMNPSKESCEKVLKTLPEPSVIAMSILAAGRIPLKTAAQYIGGLKDYFEAVAVGISKENHARETFKVLRKNILHTSQ